VLSRRSRAGLPKIAQSVQSAALRDTPQNSIGRIDVLTSTGTLAQAFDEICMMDGPLNARLAAYAAKLRELNFPFAEAYDVLVARLYAGEVGNEAPRVGEMMPPFILPSRDGAAVSLEELIANGPLVISFNRGHWCPFCKIYLRAIADFHRQISSHSARVVSIMPDRQQFLDEARASTGGGLDILTDVDNGYALSLGLVMWLGDTLKELMKGRGYHLDAYHGSDGWFVPLPATFVVDRNQRIVGRFVDPDFRKRVEIDDIVAVLKKTE
jgi:peroxiredoxin